MEFSDAKRARMRRRYRAFASLFFTAASLAQVSCKNQHPEEEFTGSDGIYFEPLEEDNGQPASGWDDVYQGEKGHAIVFNNRATLAVDRSAKCQIEISRMSSSRLEYGGATAVELAFPGKSVTVSDINCSKGEILVDRERLPGSFISVDGDGTITVSDNLDYEKVIEFQERQ